MWFIHINTLKVTLVVESGSVSTPSKKMFSAAKKKKRASEQVLGRWNIVDFFVRASSKRLFKGITYLKKKKKKNFWFSFMKNSVRKI